MTTTTNDRAGELLERLHTEVAALITSDDWQAWLRVAARFHRYSFNNLLLVYAQRPDATHVAGYRHWQSLGRQVRRGERGIFVLAPCTRRVTDTDDETGETTDRTVVRGFRSVTVFDIAQTDGDPLPTPTAPTLLDGTAPGDLLDRLTLEITAAGFTYERAPLPPMHAGANGITDHTIRTVTVRPDLPDAHAAKTTAHELAHVLLHGPDRAAGISRSQVEVEAESVAFIICTAAGLDPSGYSLPYVAAWSGGDVDRITVTATRVLTTARTILDRIDPSIYEHAKGDATAA